MVLWLGLVVSNRVLLVIVLVIRFVELFQTIRLDMSLPVRATVPCRPLQELTIITPLCQNKDMSGVLQSPLGDFRRTAPTNIKQTTRASVS